MEGVEMEKEAFDKYNPKALCRAMVEILKSYGTIEANKALAYMKKHVDVEFTGKIARSTLKSNLTELYSAFLKALAVKGYKKQSEELRRGPLGKLIQDAFERGPLEEEEEEADLRGRYFA